MATKGGGHGRQGRERDHPATRLVPGGVDHRATSLKKSFPGDVGVAATG